MVNPNLNKQWAEMCDCVNDQMKSFNALNAKMLEKMSHQDYLDRWFSAKKPEDFVMVQSQTAMEMYRLTIEYAQNIMSMVTTFGKCCGDMTSEFSEGFNMGKGTEKHKKDH